MVSAKVAHRLFLFPPAHITTRPIKPGEYLGGFSQLSVVTADEKVVVNDAHPEITVVYLFKAQLPALLSFVKACKDVNSKLAVDDPHEIVGAHLCRLRSAQIDVHVGIDKGV